MEQSIARAVDALGSKGAQEHVLSFILAQADRLRKLRSEADAEMTKREIHRQSRRRKTAVTPALALRALVIDERLPLAGIDGGSQVVLSHMSALQRLGYNVGFAACEGRAHGDDIARAMLASEGIICHETPVHGSIEDVLKREADGLDWKTACKTFQIPGVSRPKLMRLRRGAPPREDAGEDEWLVACWC